MPTTCANPSCPKLLGGDHVLLITTSHVRHFCSVECIEPSRRAWERARQVAYRDSKTPEEFVRRLGHPTNPE